MDPQRLAQLVDQHAAALQLYAGQWTRSPDDCVQEAFVELARQTNTPENPVAWLYRVVRNRALNAARAQQRRTNHESRSARLRIERQESADRNNALNEGPNAQDLQQALAALDERQREIVILRLWSGLGWEEIAQLTSTPSSTAHRLYTKALQQLRKLFHVKLVL